MTSDPQVQVQVPLLDPASPAGAAVRRRRAALNEVLRRAAAQGAAPEDLLRTTAEVAGLVRGLEVALPEDRFDATLEALVGSAAALCAQGRAGAHGPEHRALAVAATAVPWLAVDPRPVVGAMVAAAPTVARQGDLDAWLRRVAAAATAEQGVTAGADLAARVRSVVVVAAWRSGLARFRDAALAAVDELPRAVAVAALDLPAELAADPSRLGEAVLTPHRADRWWWPGSRTAPGVLARHGGFRGLGGPWLRRPVVLGWVGPAEGGPGWLVEADDVAWLVVADVHGSAITRFGDAAADGVTGRPRPPAHGAPHVGVVPWTDEVTGLVAVDAPAWPGPVALVSRAHSYCVDVVRLPRRVAA
ncbi:hypothetical protein GXB85_04235 [Cellulomonas sp. APG4]|uniref:hypothetical protein n=1 Tax=Cellulomonas sp. APG4 TaxID=1538656 RepID=UPI0013796E51|nr:hypothetical protein [Cellulomonas sp. APG4]NCT90162.1 hypothetical protein [Cellulomonas sp. APG4]